MPRPRAVSGPLRETDRHVAVTVRTDPIAFQPPEGTVSTRVSANGSPWTNRLRRGSVAAKFG